MLIPSSDFDTEFNLNTLESLLKLDEPTDRNTLMTDQDERDDKIVVEDMENDEQVTLDNNNNNNNVEQPTLVPMAKKNIWNIKRKLTIQTKDLLELDKAADKAADKSADKVDTVLASYQDKVLNMITGKSAFSSQEKRSVQRKSQLEFKTKMSALMKNI